MATGIDEIVNRDGAAIPIAQNVPIAGRAGQFRGNDLAAQILQGANRHAAGTRLARGHRRADHEDDRHAQRAQRRQLDEILHGYLAAIPERMAEVLEGHQVREQRRRGRRFSEQPGAGQGLHAQVRPDIPPVADALQRGRPAAEGTDELIAHDHLGHAAGLGLAPIETAAHPEGPADDEIAGGPGFRLAAPRPRRARATDPTCE